MHEISPDLIPARRAIVKPIKLGARDEENDVYPDVFEDES